MEQGIDPAFVDTLRAITEHPERAKVVEAYPYREATVRSDYRNKVSIETMEPLWSHLSQAAGWDRRQNHSVFLFEFDGGQYTVKFTDLIARFGPADGVVLTRTLG